MKKVVDIKFVALRNEEELLNANDIGIRFTDDEFNIGDDVPNSYDWNKTEILPREEWEEKADLGGACGLSFDHGWNFDDINEAKESMIEMLNDAGWYLGAYVYLIKGYQSWWGEDDHERIYRGAEVIGIIELIKG